MNRTLIFGVGNRRSTVELYAHWERIEDVLDSPELRSEIHNRVEAVYPFIEISQEKNTSLFQKRLLPQILIDVVESSNMVVGMSKLREDRDIAVAVANEFGDALERLSRSLGLTGTCEEIVDQILAGWIPKSEAEVVAEELANLLRCSDADLLEGKVLAVAESTLRKYRSKYPKP
jgi:hypothetical protein